MRSKKAKRLIAEIRQERESCALDDMTFAPIPEEYKKVMSDHVRHGFNNWWRSWIAPKLEELEKSS